MKINFELEFIDGSKREVFISDPTSVTLDDTMEMVRAALIGLGFNARSVDEYFGDYEEYVDDDDLPDLGVN